MHVIFQELVRIQFGCKAQKFPDPVIVAFVRVNTAADARCEYGLKDLVPTFTRTVSVGMTIPYRFQKIQKLNRSR